MNALLKKEFSLSLFPLPYLFTLLAGLMLIPNYPYFVSLFYTSLGIMFLFQYNRENHDTAYLMTLPVRKRDMVFARFIQVIAIEVLQLLVCVPVMLIRGLYAHLNNAVGFEANLAFLGLGAVMLGVFNLIFLPGHYKDGYRIGIPFVWSCIASFLYICAAEVSLRAVPYFARYCDSMALSDQLHQIPILIAGLLLAGALTLIAYRISVKRFEQLDL